MDSPFQKISIANYVPQTLNDDTLFTPFDIATETDTINYVMTMYPYLTNTSLTTILSLYPRTDFTANTTANMASEFYRSAQIVRDILLVCPNFYLGHAISQKCLPDSARTSPAPTWNRSRKPASDCPKAPVYYYEQNQTILTPYLEYSGMPGLGVVHTSELPYVFGNLSIYNTSAYSFFPSTADYALARRQSRSWSTFAYCATPVGDGETLKGWEAAYEGAAERDRMMDARVFVVGGGEEGLSGLEGEGAREGVRVQRLKERCEFFNSEEIIAQLKY